MLQDWPSDACCLLHHRVSLAVFLSITVLEALHSPCKRETVPVNSARLRKADASTAYESLLSDIFQKLLAFVDHDVQRPL